jgi:hypothetical protein
MLELTMRPTIEGEITKYAEPNGLATGVAPAEE